MVDRESAVIVVKGFSLLKDGDDKILSIGHFNARKIQKVIVSLMLLFLRVL